MYLYQEEGKSILVRSICVLFFCIFVLRLNKFGELDRPSIDAYDDGANMIHFVLAPTKSSISI